MRVKNQQYCSNGACQKGRKREWEKRKRAWDADYRLNQAAAQKAWRDTHPDYWKEYRRTHPEYVAANREKQRRRRGLKKSGRVTVANTDASRLERSIIPGRYRLVPVAGDRVANMDEIQVELSLVSSG